MIQFHSKIFMFKKQSIACFMQAMFQKYEIQFPFWMKMIISYPIAVHIQRILKRLFLEMVYFWFWPAGYDKKPVRLIPFNDNEDELDKFSINNLINLTLIKFIHDGLSFKTNP